MSYYVKVVRNLHLLDYVSKYNVSFLTRVQARISYFRLPLLQFETEIGAL